MHDLVDFMARSVIAHPDNLELRQDEGESSVIFELDVHPDDRALLVENDASLLRAMQVVLSAASGTRKSILDLTGSDAGAVGDEEEGESDEA